MALLSESADVRFDAGATSADAVVAAVEGCGFTARIVSTSGGESAAAGGSGSSGGKVKLEVRGMHCGACSSGVCAAACTCCCLPCKRSMLCCTAAVVSLYVVGAHLLHALLTGRSAAWLIAAVEAALLKVQGVQSASVSLTVQQAEVRHSGGSGLEQRLVEAVEGCGFDATGEGGGLWYGGLEWVLLQQCAVVCVLGLAKFLIQGLLGMM